jgi:uncharacterized protein
MTDMTSREKLEEALLALDDRAMVLEELDGFIAGLLICPETIPPGEWFAAAFGLQGRGSSTFESIDHANEVLALVMDYYNGIAAVLARHPELYSPLFPVDARNGDVIWELWIEGFAAATNLRRSSFDAYADGDDDIAIAATGMMALIGASLDEDADPADLAEIGGRAPELIKEWIVTLYQYRLTAQKPASFEDQPNPFAGLQKVGRNDPCPCGSGKKYKRCCGAN